MATWIREIEKPKLKNPLFLEGLPGVGNVGRIAAGYLVEELKAKKFAELYSSHFMPFVLLHQSSAVHVLKNEFYYWKAKEKNQRDLIILIGDSQSADPEGHYEIVNTILDYLEKFGVKEIITLAGLSIGEMVEKPKVVGAVSDEEMIKKYQKYGIDFEAGSRVGTIVGASGLIIGLGRIRGMKGVCLLGETVGFPIIPDPKSAEALLRIVVKILNVKIDTSKIEKKVREMEEFIKKVEEVRKRALGQLLEPMEKPRKEEKLSYIG
ncbi:MAG: proteasome assembly chaperone family protein [Candidatus Aenigmarchaeota archaeon]|nr:proteasome assembly chaperone family protein [Candidatus Aenigmarchaeota archaeon]